MTKYVTQGTIQLQKEKEAGKFKLTAWINPSSDFTVKYQKEEYIVFILENPTPSKEEALVFKKDQPFSLSEEFEDWCECDGNTKLEIGIDGNDTNPEIISLKIPASF